LDHAFVHRDTRHRDAEDFGLRLCRLTRRRRPDDHAIRQHCRSLNSSELRCRLGRIARDDGATIASHRRNRRVLALVVECSGYNSCYCRWPWEWLVDKIVNSESTSSPLPHHRVRLSRRGTAHLVHGARRRAVVAATQA
jgi:hypothetical protein